MKTLETGTLAAGHCVPCEAGVEKYTVEEAKTHLSSLDGWKLTHGGLRIRKDWQMKGFSAGVAFFGRVAEVAQQQRHHPDLHLENYRDAWIETWTHAIGGLSRNDFILAAKIDRLCSTETQ